MRARTGPPGGTGPAMPPGPADPAASPVPRGPLGPEKCDRCVPDPVQETARDALLVDRERVAFLAEASAALAGSLHLTRTLARALHLVVPRFGCWAQVVVLEARELRCVALPAGVTGVDALLERTVERAAWQGFASVLTTGRTEHTHLGDASALAALVPSPDLAADALATTPTAREVGPVHAVTVPLVARGTPFAVLVVLRAPTSPPMDEAEGLLLEDLCRRVALALDAARLYGERTHVAQVLQSSLRPPQLPEVPGVRLAARYRAATEQAEIGGDFYDVHGAGEDWSLVVGDVCGKGVEAAVLTGQARHAVRTAALVDRDPAQVLRLLNTVLHSADPTGSSFATVACARLLPPPGGDVESGVRLDLASAGHPPPLLVRRDGRVHEAPVGGLLVGPFPDTTYDTVALQLLPGEACLFYTDGVTEAPGADGEFGTERLVRLLGTCAGGEPEVLVDVVVQAVLEHLRGRAHDDIALLALQALP